METITLGNLAKGTKKKLMSLAVRAGYTKHNGTANLSDYVRFLIEKDTGVKQCKD